MLVSGSLFQKNQNLSQTNSASKKRCLIWSGIQSGSGASLHVELAGKPGCSIGFSASLMVFLSFWISSSASLQLRQSSSLLPFSARVRCGFRELERISPFLTEREAVISHERSRSQCEGRSEVNENYRAKLQKSPTNFPCRLCPELSKTSKQQRKVPRPARTIRRSGRRWVGRDIHNCGRGSLKAI